MEQKLLQLQITEKNYEIEMLHIDFDFIFFAKVLSDRTSLAKLNDELSRSLVLTQIALTLLLDFLRAGLPNDAIWQE